MPLDVEQKKRRATRAEIELLCVLHVIGREGCAVADVTSKLGLSPTLAHAIAAAVKALTSSGFLDVIDERVAISEAGARWQRERLTQLGIAG